MTCYKNCCQGRDCECSRDGDKQVVVAVLFILLMVSMLFLIYKLLNGNTGQDCAVEVQFSGGVKATYLGKTV